MRLARTLIVGAGAAYLLDPAHGRHRRRRLADRAARLGRWLRDEARGTRGNAPGTEPVDDLVVLEVIRTEVLPDAGVPPDDVDVWVEDGVATIHGSLESASSADDLVRRVQRVPGVRDVAAMIRVSAGAGGAENG
jgi:hypothetical protein